MPSERVQRQIDRLLDEAESALAEGKWDVARVRAEAALRLDPANSDAKAYLAAATLPASPGQAAGAREIAVPQTSRTVPGAKVGFLPTSFSSGRYVVKKFLGEGGKKKVYLAHDTVLDRDVAFALIKLAPSGTEGTEGLDEASRTRVTREAQAMGRLGDHPNIVPIFDLGQEKDPATGASQPFMVLPLMTGGDVEGVIEKAPGNRMPLERALQITQDVCEGLVFAHSKGIVHRDLKPGNVWLTDASTGSGRAVARIGDFGLAVATDKSRLTREGMMVGTVAYMPPEQAMGGEVTPRADLYSLGAMLYEMVTGRPPFLGDDDIAIIGQHINTPPVAPTWHRADCPRPLDALIMRLLAKDPKQRPESAQDVLRALEGVELYRSPQPSPARGEGVMSARPELGSPDPGERVQGPRSGDGAPRLRSGQAGQGAGRHGVPSPSMGEGQGEGDTALREPQGTARSLDSMASGVFVGRQKEMNQLKGALEEALSGHGRMVTLVGEPGIGKTRTAQELQTYAGLRRAQVLWGRCYDGGGAPPYWPWVQAIRQYVRERPAEDLKREMGSTASVIAEVVSDVKERIPNLQPPPQLDSPESARFRLFDSIATFLKTASQSQPLVLILDDLHWSDKPSLLLLEFVAREIANARVLLVGTYRDMELNRKHPLAVTLGDLSKERLFEKVLLRGLQAHDIGRFIELAAGLKPPSGLVEAVHTQTEGNPLFVTEVVRWLVQEGALTREHLTPSPSTGEGRGEGEREAKSRSARPELVEGPRPGGKLAAGVSPSPQPSPARGEGAKRESWTMPIPEGVRDVIGKRLDRLSPRCNDVLTTASIIGRRFVLAALAQLYGSAPLTGLPVSPERVEGSRPAIPSPWEGDGSPPEVGAGEGRSPGAAPVGEGAASAKPIVLPPLPIEERMSEDRLLDVLEEALSARIIEELPSGPGRYMFTHALIQETLAGEISTTRKVRLHARIALVLEDLYKDRLEERAVELAGHFAEAETVLGTEKFVFYSRIAGERALASFAHEEALLMFRRALVALGSGPMDAARAALTAGAAAANAALRNTEASLADLRTAFDYYVGAGDFARAAVIAQQKFVSAEGIVGMAPLQERALQLLPIDSVSAGLILVRHSRAVGVFQGDYARGNAEINRALEIAQLHKDRYLELQAHAAGAHVNLHNLKPDAEFRHALRVVELTKTIDDPLEASFSYYVLASGSALEGNAEQSRAYRDAAIAAASRAQDRERLSSVHMVAAGLAELRGEWDEARRFSDISLGYWEDDFRTQSLRTIVEYQTGDNDAGDRWLARLRKNTDRMSALPLALIEWQVEHISGAQRPGDRSIDAGPAEPSLMRSASARAFAVAVRCCDALMRDDATPEYLSQLYHELVAIGPSSLSSLYGFLTNGISDFPAFLARKLGDYDGASAHFEESMRIKRKAGFRPYLAWTCADYAEMLLERASSQSAGSGQADSSAAGGSGQVGAAGADDREKALKLDDEALTIARDLGMKPLIERIIRRREILRA